MGSRATFTLADFESDEGPILPDEEAEQVSGGGRRSCCGMTGYQCFVLLASWLGWGFDVFDGLLFNFVAPVCIPYLLGVDPKAELDQETREVITFWTASLTSLLLVGWAIGGIIFGKLTDAFGRSRVMLITISLYAISTGASAFSPNIWVLGLCRFSASLGIGGEWAAGASLVAETMPPHMRLWGGALLYTSAPAGLFLASMVSSLFLNEVSFIADDPSLSWRVVFLTGLIPVIFAIIMRIWLKEPDTWRHTRATKRHKSYADEDDDEEDDEAEQDKQLHQLHEDEDEILGKSASTKKRMGAAHVLRDELGEIVELFGRTYLRRTLGGLFIVVVALLTWWTITSFIPLIANFLAEDVGQARGLSRDEVQGLKSEYTFVGSNSFNLGGLVGTLATVPFAQYLGRRPMFVIYFAWSAVAIPCVLYLPMGALLRLSLLCLVGFSVFGIFGAFTFYLPELFPTRLRALGAGFCYNSGRIITAVGPFLVGVVSRGGYDPLYIITWVAVLPVVGFVGTLLRLPPETKGISLLEEQVDHVHENLYLLHREVASSSSAANTSTSSPTKRRRANYGTTHDEEDLDIFLK